MRPLFFAFVLFFVALAPASFARSLNSLLDVEHSELLGWRAAQYAQVLNRQVVRLLSGFEPECGHFVAVPQNLAGAQFTMFVSPQVQSLQMTPDPVMAEYLTEYSGLTHLEEDEEATYDWRRVRRGTRFQDHTAEDWNSTEDLIVPQSAMFQTSVIAHHLSLIAKVALAAKKALAEGTEREQLVWIGSHVYWISRNFPIGAPVQLLTPAQLETREQDTAYLKRWIVHYQKFRNPLANLGESYLRAMEILGTDYSPAPDAPTFSYWVQSLKKFAPLPGETP
jgi:hypothetical protein